MNKHDQNSNWLSVLIPAYNCSKTIERLLNSILIQNDNDIEVIICDDWSTDNFMNKVEPYKNKLNIKYFKTIPRDLHCPGNTRFDAWHHATGEWITFIDNDDMFEPGAFLNIKKALKNTKEKRIILSEINICNEIENISYSTTSPPLSLLHGHWYNRQWLINENIDFKENLESYEDVYFNNLVFAALYMQTENITIIDDKTYRWIIRKESISNNYGKDKYKFAKEHFSNYNTAIYDPWINSYKKYYPNYKDRSFIMLCDSILHLYFHSQYIAFIDNTKRIKPEIFNIIKSDILEICKIYDCTIQDIINFVYNNLDLYFNSKNNVINVLDRFIETTSFYDLLNSFLN